MAGVITNKENLCNGSKCPIDTYIYTRSTMGFSECVSGYKHTKDEGLSIKYSKSSNTFLCLPLTSCHKITRNLKIVPFKNNYLDQNNCRMLGQFGARRIVRWKTNKPLFISHLGQHTHTRWDSSRERRREFYLTAHNTHNRQTSMPPVRF
jgi:hypothetical protein